MSRKPSKIYSKLENYLDIEIDSWKDLQEKACVRFFYKITVYLRLNELALKLSEKLKIMMTQQEAMDKFLPLINTDGKQYDKKTEILVRQAEVGEAIHTFTSDGKETTNVAKENDFVVQNMTEAKELYILSREQIKSRYEKIDDQKDGWIRYKAIGSVKGVRYNGEEIEFMAIWGQPMALKKGDMIVTTDGSEVYRIAWKEFNETYAS